LEAVPVIGLKVLHQVANMDVTIGVGESRRHQNFAW
jgi:hypothetical protein